MGSARGKVTGWRALLGVAVLLLGAGAVAAAATASLPAHGVGPSSLAATGLGEQLPEQATTTTSLTPTSVARPSTTVGSTSSTASVKPARSTTNPTVATTVAPPAGVATTIRVIPPAVGTPKTNPSSWTLEDSGITSFVRIEPAAPRVGDTVTITFGSTATVATDYCCIDHLYVDGTLIVSQNPPPGPCPLAQGPAEQRVSYVVTHAGTLDLQLQSNRVKLCAAPPEFTTTNLYAASWVQPAA